ncbi:MAG: hypothetical protein L6R36_008213, partial [Xanthoria steineri]
MSSAPRSNRRSASPVSSRTRASPSNGVSSRRAASVPLSLPSRTARTGPTPPPKSPTPPPKLPIPPSNQLMAPAIESLPHVSPASLADSTHKSPLNPLTHAKLRQALRAQYRWDIPLDTGCEPHLPDLPTRKRKKVVTIERENVYEYAFQSHYLGRISVLKIILSAGSQSYSLHPEGEPFPFRGQGPIWDQNSCHLDCCIVAARLLNVGFTIADRGKIPRDLWLQGLQPLQQRFLDLISADWESMNQATNIRRRHDFWDHELASLEEISKRPRFGSAVSVGDSCTSQMGQFGFDRRDRFSSCKYCGAAPSEKPARHHQYLSLDMSQGQYQEHKSQAGDKPIEYWIDRELKPLNKRCGACKSPDGRSLSREIVGALPQRLVVVPGQFVQGLISGATSDCVQFSYWTADGEQKAAYRWLGGIYHRNKHFRLYWTDGEKGAPYPKVRVYDGREGCGAIIGGVPAFNDKDKVVPAWSRTATILFYERIDEAALGLAAESIRSRLDDALADALRIESIGAQAPVIADTQQEQPQGGQAAEEMAEEEGKVIGTEHQGVSTGPSSHGSKVPSEIDLGKVLGNGDEVQPDQHEEENVETLVDTAKEISGDGKDQDKSDSESSLSSLRDDERDEERDASDHGNDTPDDNQDQSKEDDTDGEEEAADGDESPDESTVDHKEQGSPRAPKSPAKTPPQSPVKSPKTPKSPTKSAPQSPAQSSDTAPPETQKSSLFSSFSPSKFFGLFTPSRSGTKPGPRPATATTPSTATAPSPSPALHPVNESTNPFADHTPESNPPTSSDDNLSLPDDNLSLPDDDPSLPDLDSEPEGFPSPSPSPPVLPTPPTSPAKKPGSKPIRPSTTGGGTRRSPRTFKPRSSARMAQMIPMNTRTAGSMGPYKPLPALRVAAAAAYDAGARGRSG